MIYTNQLFAQFGGGREAWWKEDVWKTVLRVLADYEGEPYSPSANPGLFSDLRRELYVVDPDISPTGADDQRSVFRAAPSAWVDMGVARFDGEISLTEEGRAVLNGDRSYTDCLCDMFAHYRERRNGKSPFRPLLKSMLVGEPQNFDDLFESVQRECGEEMGDWIRSSKIAGFPYRVEPKYEGNPSRSVRLMLRLVTDSGLAQGDKDKGWTGVDLPGIRAVLAKLEAIGETEGHVSVGAKPGQLDTSEILREITSKGWQFPPWQIAAFCHAVRTKPFVILAGISGTGKTKLPRLVASVTDAHHTVIPVRPDWRDSSDLMGYSDLAGHFHAGPLLRAAKKAIENPDRQHFVLLDEMNLARVEYYFAEVLSLMEERWLDSWGRSRTDPLLSAGISVPAEDNQEGTRWEDVYLPSNLALIGSVNMDETTHPFSRKVLDRAFVLEFSEVDLSNVGHSGGQVAKSLALSADDWQPTAIRLSAHPDAHGPEVRELIEELVAVNDILSTAQLQVGYRLRDEVTLFVLNVRNDPNFMHAASNPIDPIDLAICMKILPRVQGGGLKTRDLLVRLAEWAGPPDQPRMPICEARVQLLLERFDSEGFTSFWL